MAIVSHKRKYIFIHNYRTGGTSLRQALRQERQLSERVRDKVSEFGIIASSESWQTFRKHALAQEVRCRIGTDIWEEYFSFAFVRNPWSWQVSQYFYMLENEYHRQHELVSSMDNFDEYIRWRVNEDKHFQKKFVTDDTGDITVDFIGKFENLHEDFDTICTRIGIPDASFPKKNTTDKDYYKEYYNETTRKLVRDHFQPDIELFDYEY